METIRYMYKWFFMENISLFSFTFPLFKRFTRLLEDRPLIFQSTYNFLLFLLLFFFVEDAHDFSLQFPTQHTSNFVVFNGNIAKLDEFTICLWMKTAARGLVSLFSYGSALCLQCDDTGRCVMGTDNHER